MCKYIFKDWTGQQLISRNLLCTGSPEQCVDVMNDTRRRDRENWAEMTGTYTTWSSPTHPRIDREMLSSRLYCNSLSGR